jgi:hypothetical protein
MCVLVWSCEVSSGLVGQKSGRIVGFGGRHKIGHSGLLILHDTVHRFVQLSFDLLVGRKCSAQGEYGLH